VVRVGACEGGGGGTGAVGWMGALPVAQSNANLNCVPFAMPSPHWPGPVPACWQVITPLTLLHPWLVSSEVALATLNGYAPWPLLACWTGGVHWLAGWVGVAPEVGTLEPR